MAEILDKHKEMVHGKAFSKNLFILVKFINFSIIIHQYIHSLKMHDRAIFCPEYDFIGNKYNFLKHKRTSHKDVVL